MKHRKDQDVRDASGRSSSDGRTTKRATVWRRIGASAFYAVSALAIVYLALYAYAIFSKRDFEPGDPIHIFRNPGAPNYSLLDKGVLVPCPPTTPQGCAAG